MGNTKRRLLLTTLVLGVLGSVAAYGTYSAFTATTTNSGNQFASGTVALDDESGATTALFPNLTNLVSAVQKCLRIRYTGSLTAVDVKLYISSGAPATPPGDKYTLQVERAVGGTGLTTRDGTRSCAGFGTGGTVSDAFAAADIGTFPTAFAGGADGKASGGDWTQNDWVDFRFTLTPKAGGDNDHTTTNAIGPFAFTWKATS